MALNEGITFLLKYGTEKVKKKNILMKSKLKILYTLKSHKYTITS